MAGSFATFSNAPPSPTQAGYGTIDDVNAAKAGIQRNTEGRATELENDPRMNQAMDFFSQTMSGANGPYTDASKAAMLGQAGNSSASAQAAQMKALQDATAASGGSIYDPSFQAKAQELNANRQGQNLDAQGQIESQAAQANYNARMAGASDLASARSTQNAQINQMRGQAANYQSQVTAALPTPAAAPAKTGGIQYTGPSTANPVYDDPNKFWNNVHAGMYGSTYV